MSTCEVANCTADAVATLAVYEGLAPQATVSPVLELCQLHSGVHLDVLEAYCREVGMPSAQHLVDSTPRHLGLSRFIEGVRLAVAAATWDRQLTAEERAATRISRGQMTRR